MAKTVVINNPIINSLFEEPKRHFYFDDEGITDRLVGSRRTSAYFVPIARPKKKAKDRQLTFDDWTADRIEENKAVNIIRERVRLWREGGYPQITARTRRLLDQLLPNTGPRGLLTFLKITHRWNSEFPLKKNCLQGHFVPEAGEGKR